MIDVVEKFRPQLTELERERLKVRRDLNAYRFVILMGCLLGAVCAITLFFAQSQFLISMTMVLFVGSLLIALVASEADATYQAKFRNAVTRTWFHERFLGVFLAAPALELEVSLPFLYREAALFLPLISSRRNAHVRVRVEDRIYFDRETEESHITVIANGGRRKLVFMKRREEIAPTPEYFVRALSKYGKVRVKSTNRGLWVALDLSKRLFSAPVKTSTLDPNSYESWVGDAKVLLDPDVRLHWIGAR